METGTCKTYVYLRTIFELSQQYGFQKFIVVVPSVAIREGVLKNQSGRKCPAPIRARAFLHLHPPRLVHRSQPAASGEISQRSDDQTLDPERTRQHVRIGELIE